MKIKKLLPFTLAFIIAGCVPIWSLYPLYDDKHIVFDEKLLGTFIDDNNDATVTWEFTRANKPNTYRLIHSFLPKEEPNVMKGLFEAHLVKLNGHFFIDIIPREPPWGNGYGDGDLKKLQWPFNSLFMMPVHTFVKVEILESELKIWPTDVDDLKKLLKADPNAVKYELVDNTPVLTASPQQLQSFVLKYADDNRLFSDGRSLTLKISKPAKDVNEPKTTTTDVNNIPRDSKTLPLELKATTK
jgi:hypothetical protein